MRRCLVVVLVLAGWVGPVVGQTDTWTGGGASNNFSLGGNWLDGTAPPATNTAGDLLFGLESGGNPDYIVVLNQGKFAAQRNTQEVRSFTFGAAAGAYQMNRLDATYWYNIKTTGSGSGLAVGLNNQSSEVMVFNTGIVSDFANSSTFTGQEWRSGGGLIFNQAIEFNSSSKSITFTGAGNVTFQRAVQTDIAVENLTGSAAGIIMNGTGTMLLNAVMKDVPILTVNSGTFRLGADNLIVHSSGNSKRTNLTMGGGVFETDGFDATFAGTLTLTGDSRIDMGSGGSVLRFNDSSATTWNTGATLFITNWEGDWLNGGGGDQIFIGTSAAGITEAQRQRIVFVNPHGLPTGHYEARILATGEIVPVPEPVAVGIGLALLGWGLWRERGKLGRVVMGGFWGLK